MTLPSHLHELADLAQAEFASRAASQDIKGAAVLYVAHADGGYELDSHSTAARLENEAARLRGLSWLGELHSACCVHYIEGHGVVVLVAGREHGVELHRLGSVEEGALQWREVSDELARRVRITDERAAIAMASFGDGAATYLPHLSFDVLLDRFAQRYRKELDEKVPAPRPHAALVWTALAQTVAPHDTARRIQPAPDHWGARSLSLYAGQELDREPAVQELQEALREFAEEAMTKTAENGAPGTVLDVSWKVQLFPLVDVERIRIGEQSVQLSSEQHDFMRRLGFEPR